MTQIEAHRQSRTNCKTRLTKFKTFLDKCIIENTAVEEIQLRLNKMDENWKEYDKAQLGLETLAPSANREIERSEFEEIHFRYCTIATKMISDHRQSLSPEPGSHGGEVNHLTRIAQLEAELNAQRKKELVNLRELVARNTTPSDETFEKVRNIRLPTLTLPIFSGGYGEWLGFRDAFSAIIHDDPSIPKIQKLRYLQAKLKGEAAQVIESIETSSDNYDEAWDLLKERFNNERVIIQNHMQAIFDLSIISRESVTCLRTFYDGILRHMRALKVLKEPTDSWDTPMICLLTAKLDKDSRREWEKAVSGNRMPKFDRFLEFLRDRCQLLEAINAGCSESNKLNTRPSNKLQTNNEKKLIGKSFLNAQPIISCYNCKNNHVVNKCPEFLNLSVNDRKELVKK